MEAEKRDQPARSENFREELQGNSERSQPTETHDDAEALNDFWSMERDFIYRHHVEPRVQFHVLQSQMDESKLPEKIRN